MVVAREVGIGHRENDDILEVEVTCLENAKYLDAIERLALIRYCNGLKMAA
jgi:hypothetical protein